MLRVPYLSTLSPFIVPDAVGSLTFDNILDTSLEVKWTVPQNINGHLVGKWTFIC